MCVVHTPSPLAIVARRWTCVPTSREMTRVSASHSCGNSAATCATGQWCWHSWPPLAMVEAAAALRWISAQGGAPAVSAFAEQRVAALEARCRAAMEGAGDDPLARAEALAQALTTEGYAASASAIASGGQLCQHHCPVAHVAAEFPQLCEAETRVISQLVGTHVQRLATIAHGDGVCTTHIPHKIGIVPKNDSVRTAS